MIKFKWPDNRSRRYRAIYTEMIARDRKAMDDFLNEGPWTHTCHVARQGSFQFCGVQLTIYPDGTYQLCDTTGG